MKTRNIAKHVTLSVRESGDFLPTFRSLANKAIKRIKSQRQNVKLTPGVRFVAMIIVGVLLMSAGSWALLSMVRARAGGVTVPSTVVRQTKPAAPTVTKIDGKPIKLNIPSLGMDLDIVPGEYNPATRTWNVSTTKVHYATMTPLPNNLEGNTFLYGHYRKNIFANLHTIKANETAIVTTDNGHVFYYQLSGVRTVDPTDTHGVFDYQGAPILTIQTCTGLFYEKRQLFTFNLQRVV